MLLSKRLTVIAALGLSLTSSVAFSDSTADTLLYICQYCDQIPKPQYLCPMGEQTVKTDFCGSEAWTHNGVVDCKRFVNTTRYCANGSTQTYTEERWFGAGTTCLYYGTNHDCF